jgi:hypothetical protein
MRLRRVHARPPAALAHFHQAHSTFLSMWSEIKAWLPGVALYVLGAIAPALVIALMTR